MNLAAAQIILDVWEQRAGDCGHVVKEQHAAVQADIKHDLGRHGDMPVTRYMKHVTSVTTLTTS